MTEEIIIDGGRMAGITTLKNEFKRLKKELKWANDEEKYLKDCCIKAGKELEKHSFEWDGKEKNLAVQALQLNQLYEKLEQENKELKSEVLKWQKAFSRQYQINENKGYSKAEEKYRSALEEIREIEELAYYSKGILEEPLSQRDFILDAINNYEQRRIKILNKINEVLQ